MTSREPIELDPVTGPFEPTADKRPHIPEPPPVRLVAVDDVRLEARAGLEAELDAFYVGVLRFEKEASAEGVAVLRYKAENHRLRVVMVERVAPREDMRVLGVNVPSLLEVEHKLIDAEREYVRQRGLLPGQESLLLRDPGGNWVEVSEVKEF